MTQPPAANGAARQESLIQYPCDFPIKIMGANVDGFVHAIVEVVRKHDPTFDAATIALRDSSNSEPIKSLHCCSARWIRT